MWYSGTTVHTVAISTCRAAISDDSSASAMKVVHVTVPKRIIPSISIGYNTIIMSVSIRRVSSPDTHPSMGTKQFQKQSFKFLPKYNIYNEIHRGVYSDQHVTGCNYLIQWAAIKCFKYIVN